MTVIEQALAKATDTKALILEVGAMDKTAQMFSSLFPGKKAVVVADFNTYPAAGKYVSQVLEKAGLKGAEDFVFTDPDVDAEWNYVMQVKDYMQDKEDCCIVAVGSGVMNECSKYASYLLGRRYMCVGTAVSMDGYTAYGATISKDGNKNTFLCNAPMGLILDPQVSAVAPKNLVASGYADLQAKMPAGADWIIADALGIEPINPDIWYLVQSKLRASLSDPKGARSGDVQCTAALAEGLIMSGFAMQAMQTSRPASGAEHQFSHFWEMEHLAFNGKLVSHGFKVGIGTLASTAALEFLIGYDMSKIDVEACVAAWPASWDDMAAILQKEFATRPVHLTRALKEVKDKFVTREVLRE